MSSITSVPKTAPERPNKSNRIIALIPAYNEERFIASVVLKTLPLVDIVIVVDDGSEDDTASLAQMVGALVVCHEKNQGKGVALNTGFSKARELGADILVTIDADGQHLSEELNAVIMPIQKEESDIVIGSRYLQKNSDVPIHRIWGHSVFNRLIQVTSGIASTDSQSGYRAFSATAIQRITFKSQSFSVEAEIQFLARQYDLVVQEVPITVRYQDAPKRSVIKHGFIVLNGILRLVGQYRPLMFFGGPGICVFFLGALIEGWVLNAYRVTQELAVGYGIIGLFLLVCGGFLLMTGIILHSIRAMFLDLKMHIEKGV